MIPHSIKVTHRIHMIHREYEALRDQYGRPMPYNPYELFGRNQYIYKSRYGTISLVRNGTKSRDGMFEIYPLDGDFFNDVEVYETVYDAERAITRYLAPSIWRRLFTWRRRP